jgi:LemA protein
MSVSWIILFVLVAVASWAVLAYNRMVRLRNQVTAAWADIDVQLKRRFDLIPNLVEIVKGYQRHEARVLEDVTRLRSDVQTPVRERNSRENALTGHIVRLFAVAEAYPELKAAENFRGLHHSLVEVEDHLQYARRYYNGSVRDNNNLVESFPSLLIARLFRFRSAEFFEIELASMREAPGVDL